LSLGWGFPLRRCIAFFLALSAGFWGCRRDADRGGTQAGEAATVFEVAGRGAVRLELVLGERQEVFGMQVRSGRIERLVADTSRILWGVSAVELEPARVRLDAARAQRAEQLATLLPAGALLVVNGGYFEPDLTPSGWLVSQRRELARRAEWQHGGVLALAGERLLIGRMADLDFAPEFALQSFPLIVEPGARPGIRSDDGKRAARTVACARAGKLLLVVITAARGEGPTLFEAMQLLRAAPPRGLGCDVALNLDGGPSSGIWFRPELGLRSRPPSAPVAYAIVVQPR
jgi:hypothetical protein